MIIDWGDIIKEGLKLIVPVVGIVAPLAYQNHRKAKEDKKEAAAARIERQAAAKKLDEVSGQVDGHLTNLTKALAKEATVNVALTVENDRINRDPLAGATPESGAHVTRDAASGAITVHERRKPDA